MLFINYFYFFIIHHNGGEKLKKNKTKTFITFIFLVIFLITSIGSANAANVFHVNTTGNDSNSGNQSNPFASINKSVTVTNAGNGDDEIIIASGTYKGASNRQITIAQNVSIFSAKYKNLESDETYIDVEGYNRYIFLILGPNVQVNFYGINFVNSSSPANANAAISSANASLTISNCTFNKANVYIINGNEVKLSNNVFYNYTVTPITFSNVSDSEISNNIFNTTTNIVTISVTNASNLTFFNNTFNYNFISTPTILSLSSVTGVVIKNNRFLISSRASSAILSAGNSSNFTILGNEFSNVNIAINLPNVNGAIIKDNTITNVTTGIIVTNSNVTVRIFNNTIKNASNTAISLINVGSGVFIGNNTITMPSRAATGISVGITAGNINKNVNVVSNIITNATTAITLTAVNGSAIENNTIVDSGTGIIVTNAALNTAVSASPIRIFNNTIEVTASAITLVQCNMTSVDILNNRVYGSNNNVTYGLSVTNANITRLSGNYFNNTRFSWSGSATNLNRVYEIVDNEFLNVNGVVITCNALVENLVVLNNIFDVTTSTNAVILTFSSVSGADIRNNSFYRTSKQSTAILISNGNYNNVDIINNTFNNFVTGISVTNVSGAIIEDNVLVNVTTGILATNSNDFSRIFNNTIENASTTAISLINVGNGVLIGNNTITMPSRAATGISVGITAGNINKNVNVVSNIITNATTAITLTAVNGSAIENNTIVDSGTGIIVTNTALNTLESASPIRIFNNTIEVTASAITLVQCNVTSVDILNNRVYGSNNTVTYGLSVTNANITRLSGNLFNNTRFSWSGNATNLNRVYEIVDNEFLNINGQIINCNAIIENLVILNNIFNVTGSTNQATLTFSSVNGANIRNNSFYRISNINTAILISNGNNNNLNVVNNTFNKFVTGISMTNFTTVVVENNSFVDTNTSIGLTNVTDVIINNNTITGGLSAYKVSVYGSKVNFTNNKISNANGGGVFIRADDTLFENNRIDGLVPTGTNSYAININGSNLIVRYNLLNNSGSPSMNSHGMVISGSNVTVTNNIVNNSKRHSEGILVNSDGGIVRDNSIMNFFVNTSTCNVFSLQGNDLLFEYNQVYNITLENNPAVRSLYVNGENLTVRHNVFDSGVHGILGTGNYSLFFNNTIKNLTGNGMLITYSIGAVIDMNNVTGCGGIGITAQNGGNYTISNNTVTNNTKTFGNQIYIEDTIVGSYVKIINNNITGGATASGIAIEENNSATIYIENNNISNNKANGIQVTDVSDVDWIYVISNTITDNGRHGITLAFFNPTNPLTKKFVITGNNISNNAWHGINGYIVNSTIENNIINSNGYSGIYLASIAYNNTINNNTISFNGLSGGSIDTYTSGIAMSGVNNTITNNNIYNNSKNGIYNSASENDVINNSIYNNKNGLYLTKPLVSLNGNNITSNSDNGILITFSNSDLDIFNNTIKKNGVAINIRGNNNTLGNSYNDTNYNEISENINGVLINGTNNKVSHLNIYDNNNTGVIVLLNNNTIESCNVVNNDIGFNITGNNSVVNYNRIYNNSHMGMINNGLNTNANLNWWGINNISDQYVDNSGDINLTNHFVIQLTANGFETIKTGDRVNFTEGTLVIYTGSLVLNDSSISGVDKGRLPLFNVTWTDVDNSTMSGDIRITNFTSSIVGGPNDLYIFTGLSDSAFVDLEIYFEATIPNNTKVEIWDFIGEVGKEVILNATLKDGLGNVLVNKTLNFYIYINNTWKYIGSNITNSEGIAFVSYVPEYVGKFLIKAIFDGDDGYPGSMNISTLTVKTNNTPPHNDTNKTIKKHDIDSSRVSMKSTGIPINMVMIAIISIIGIGLRRMRNLNY